MGKQNNITLRQWKWTTLRIITTHDMDVSEITLHIQGYNVALLSSVYQQQTQRDRTCFNGYCDYQCFVCFVLSVSVVLINLYRNSIRKIEVHFPTLTLSNVTHFVSYTKKYLSVSLSHCARGITMIISITNWKLTEGSARWQKQLPDIHIRSSCGYWFLTCLAACFGRKLYIVSNNNGGRKRIVNR